MRPVLPQMCSGATDEQHPGWGEHPSPASFSDEVGGDGGPVCPFPLEALRPMRVGGGGGLKELLIESPHPQAVTPGVTLPQSNTPVITVAEGGDSVKGSHLERKTRDQLFL